MRLQSCRYILVQVAEVALRSGWGWGGGGTLAPGGPGRFPDAAY